jgi:two-component system OmpR family sensor kinase
LKLGRVDLPLLDVPRLGVAAFRNRIVFHLVFVALALATLALAVALLNEEKQRNAQRYEQGFQKSLAEITAQLRHPTGQLALLNPELPQVEPGWVAPLLLPFSAIDFDDQAKAQRAVEMAGCERSDAAGSSLCVAVGSNPYAGGFIYVVASFDAPPLVGRERGVLDLSSLHRAEVTLRLRGGEQRWVAPVELLEARDGETAQRAQLPGFTVDPTDPMQASLLPQRARPQRDFRGWLWRDGPCLDAAAPDCLRRAHLSLRLPVEAFREALFAQAASGVRPVWPPADLSRIALQLRVLSPAGARSLFDSSAIATMGASSASPLQRVAASLAPGEALTIASGGRPVATLQGADTANPADAPASPWLTALIRRLPSPQAQTGLRASDSVVTPLGRFELTLTGDLQSLDRTLSASATRLAWPVGAMLAAIALAWLIIEMGLIRRVATLTRRAAAVSYNVQAPQADARLGDLDVNDLRGRDELGILAGTLSDLLARVRDGMRRDQLRAEREHDQWHAVGHEIMSPLQSLLALHAAEKDPSRRYLQRMQQAVKVLYGPASPSEALAAATLAVGRLDLDAFLRQIAENAAHAGLHDVVYTAAPEAVWVLADEYPLEDALTHLLTNADRHRTPGTPITLTLRAQERLAFVEVHNLGPTIAPDRLSRIFDYGVSDAPAADSARRGQGLFVAKTYLAKMEGSIAVRNAEGGVVFEIGLRRA